MIEVVIDTRTTRRYYLLSFIGRGFGPSRAPTHNLLIGAPYGDAQLCNYEVETGSISQSSETFGKLRDRGVTHTSMQGSVFVPLTYPVSSTVVFDIFVDCPQDIDTGILEYMPPSYAGTYNGYPATYFYIGSYTYRIQAWNYGSKILFVKRESWPESWVEYKTSPTTTVKVKVGSSGSSQRTLRSAYNSLGNAIQSAVVSTVGSWDSITISGTSYMLTKDALVPYVTAWNPNWSSPAWPQAAVQVVTNGSNPEEVVGYVRTWLNDFSFGDYLGGDTLTYHCDMGDMSPELLDQLRVVDQNVLFLIFDFADMKALAKRWKDVGLSNYYSKYRYMYRSIKHGKYVVRPRMILKDLAGKYLQEKYAVDTLVADLRRLALGATRAERLCSWDKRLHSRRTHSYLNTDGISIDYTAVLTAVVGYFPTSVTGRLQELISIGKKIGFYPRLTDLWDILPYSFVVDWIVDFGGFFDQIAAYQEVKDYFPVKYVVQSEKYVAVRDATDFIPLAGATGIVQLSHYHRWITGEVPLPSISLGVGSGLIDRWAEAGALIVQRGASRARRAT